MDEHTASKYVKFSSVTKSLKLSRLPHYKKHLNLPSYYLGKLVSISMYFCTFFFFSVLQTLASRGYRIWIPWEAVDNWSACTPVFLWQVCECLWNCLVTSFKHSFLSTVFLQVIMLSMNHITFASRSTPNWGAFSSHIIMWITWTEALCWY